MDNQISLLRIVEDTIVDGPGFRLSLYAAGCTHHCKECHNPQSWNFENGKLYSIQQLTERINRSVSNITFSGGDPFYQAQAFARLAAEIKKTSGKTIWCYTGYLFEELIQNPMHRALLQHIDVLVDGRYIAAQRNLNLLFRGSNNQRLINVPRSLQENRTVIFEYQPFPEF